MTNNLKREITKEIYERALQNGGYITDDDKNIVFMPFEIWGYGVYLPKVYKENDKYYVDYKLGSSCD